MVLTPNELNKLIAELVRNGLSQKVAVTSAYAAMRISWKKKHPSVKLPAWLEIETKGKRVKVSKVKRNPKKYKKGGYSAWTLVMKSGGYYVWKSAESPVIFQVTKSQMQPDTHSGYYDLDALLKLKGIRKNPVRPLKRKKSSKEITMQTFIDGKTYYWTGNAFDTYYQKALKFTNVPLAKLAAKAAYKKYPKANIYLSGAGITA